MRKIAFKSVLIASTLKPIFGGVGLIYNWDKVVVIDIDAF
jgi:hypothetical protein